MLDSHRRKGCRVNTGGEVQGSTKKGKVQVENRRKRCRVHSGKGNARCT